MLSSDSKRSKSELVNVGKGLATLGVESNKQPQLTLKYDQKPYAVRPAGTSILGIAPQTNIISLNGRAPLGMIKSVFSRISNTCSNREFDPTISSIPQI